MNYEEYLTKQDIERALKQDHCPHCSLKIIVKCATCGKNRLIQVKEISSIPKLLETGFFCCSNITAEKKNLPEREVLFRIQI